MLQGNIYSNQANDPNKLGCNTRMGTGKNSNKYKDLVKLCYIVSWVFAIGWG